MGRLAREGGDALGGPDGFELPEDGTTVGEARLLPHTPILLAEGDEIRFGNGPLWVLTSAAPPGSDPA